MTGFPIFDKTGYPVFKYPDIMQAKYIWCIP